MFQNLANSFPISNVVMKFKLTSCSRCVDLTMANGTPPPPPRRYVPKITPEEKSTKRPVPKILRVLEVLRRRSHAHWRKIAVWRPPAPPPPRPPLPAITSRIRPSAKFYVHGEHPIRPTQGSVIK